ncbi:hypothetical protein [Planctomycetes bacterium Pan216]|uniref:hypothetical protein n=1 Tax=Kolteria novifilia TaxID=2527975 RepID=UPI0011A3F06A
MLDVGQPAVVVVAILGLSDELLTKQIGVAFERDPVTSFVVGELGPRGIDAAPGPGASGEQISLAVRRGDSSEDILSNSYH